MKIMIKICSLILMCNLLSSQTLHADNKTLEQNFKKNYPSISLKSVQKSPFKGIYEVYAAGKIIYTDEKAEYLLFGNLVDINNQKNLTTERLTELNKIDVTKLPIEQAIKYIKGTGKRKLYVFTDPDCPYCQKLEQYMTSIDNVTVYLFLYPLKQLHPRAEIISEEIWCSKNQYEAWEDYMLHRKPPQNPTRCKTPIQKNLDLGQHLQIEGTPTIFLENGIRIAGIPLDSQQIEQLLQQAELE